MFSSAFKSFTSNITSNYEISKQPTASCGAWTIFDAKKKSTNVQASVFVFERKSLEVSSNGFGSRTSATSLRKIQDEVVERLKTEASSLARLRHPSILQLFEPVEDTRSGGLMFVTEPVIASLSGALGQKDKNDGRGRYTSDAIVSQDVELDELEIQKGLLQVAKGLEFLHDSAKLVHGNLTPDGIYINAKSDWKISGLAFAGPADGAEGHQSIPQISLSEVLHLDSRIPQTVQMNLDYTSPDFVLDHNINFSADIFSLGLVLLACYRVPHISPIETHGNQSTYKKLFSSSSTVPSPSNNYLCSTKLPNELEQVLPRILARRPTSRMNASEFQQSQYFDNILVNTMRFLDGLPAKSTAEKTSFMRGLGRVMPQFPTSVLGKKILTALLEELKDKELLSLILQNVFQILTIIPKPEDALSTKVLPRLRDIFLSKSKTEEKDTLKEAGLKVFLENIKLVSENCTATQFKDDALPIVHVAMESSTHSLVDSALHTLGIILPVLDFSTVKHDLFPVISNVFSKTSSLGIKVRGLEALAVLCGATDTPSTGDDLSGVVGQTKQKSSVSSLDKFTMQEKVVPLLKGIKTKEPAVMMAALRVFKQITIAGDVDFLAMEVMPILWTFALGPLLDLSQFKAYMQTIRSLSDKIEREQIRKLRELSSSTQPTPGKTIVSPISNGANGSAVEEDFEKLVVGSRTSDKKDVFAGALSDGEKLTPNPPSFSWSSGPNTTTRPMQTMTPLQPTSRSITPDVPISSFPTLQPAPATNWNRPQLTTNNSASRLQPTNYMSTPAIALASNVWQTSTPSNTDFTPILAPPPQNRPAQWQPNYNVSTPTLQPALQPSSMNVLQPRNTQIAPPQNQQKTGLDKYESLL